ncbi:MAG TPA: error-prone DNA polymerase [Aliidongia sp.]|nr:error-prone DNA polymerase [Aliidongia sp.]
MNAVYAELDAISNFSFLEGGSHPQELIATAKALGLKAIGVADRNSLAGVVRAHAAAQEVNEGLEEDEQLQLLIGCRLVFTDGAELIVYPRDRAAYGRLCRLLSIGKSGVDAEVAEPAQGTMAKGECRLSFEQAVRLGEGLVAIARPPLVLDEDFAARLAAWRRDWPDSLYLAAAPLYRGDDRARLEQLARLARRAGVPLVATNAVLYHDPGRRMLQDVLACIRDGVTIDEAGLRLQAHAERYLKAPAEMAALFHGHEEALARTIEIAAACRFSLADLKYEYPHEPVPPGKTPQQHLRNLAFKGLRERFDRADLPKVVPLVRKELRLIRKVGYATYFLTVHDIVAWARSVDPPILCQGRGSAANSVVCFCLGITSVNPTQQDVLFERFISEQRKEPPDIDVDFEHERRELVMQYVYRRYGRHRAAICATVIHYRPRSAIRDVGKALGLTEDVTAALANTVWGSYGPRVEDRHVDAVGLKREDVRLRQALALTEELIQFPRHLSQHVGGFVLTEGPLVETVPIGNAAMTDRSFIEWDKDDIDVLGIMKVDVLALGMLSAIRKAFELIDEHYGEHHSLQTVPREEPSVYDMLCKAESLGVFQVESRAQMNMLPRLRPREFYDLVVQVAIVRPGPIQGKMVHPYLKRRAEKRAAEAAGEPFRIPFPEPSPDKGPPDELRQVLEKTMGVPLFQEQAMRIAMVAAEFSGDEANGLRRAMATFRHMGTIHTYEEAMVGRMIARGYDPEFATNCFNQIKGFGEYGFPESHAAAFAHLVYVSAWIKCFHPDVFAAALLNSQPMGFYAPAQIIRDARKNRVGVHHPDINHSDWDCTLESVAGQKRRALRLGLRQIEGFRREWAETIERVRREGGPFRSLDELRRRTALPAAGFDILAAADAMGSLDLARRPALWAARGLPRTAPAPLFAAMGLEEADGTPPAALPVPPLSEEVVQDYETIRLSLKAHPMSFLRGRFAELGVTPAAAVEVFPDSRRLTVAGLVLVRQRPGSAKGVVFLTLEDETGITNIVVWPKIFDLYRPIVMGARLVLVSGLIQRAVDAEGGVIHLVAEKIEDRTGDLAYLSEAIAKRDGERDETMRRHPRNVRVLPRSRDFH